MDQTTAGTTCAARQHGKQARQHGADNQGTETQQGNEGRQGRHGKLTLTAITSHQRPINFFSRPDAGSWTDGIMLRPDGMTWWPVLIDVDAQPQFVPWQKRISSSLTQQEKP